MKNRAGATRDILSKMRHHFWVREHTRGMGHDVRAGSLAVGIWLLGAAVAQGGLFLAGFANVTPDVHIAWGLPYAYAMYGSVCAMGLVSVFGGLVLDSFAVARFEGKTASVLASRFRLRVQPLLLLSLPIALIGLTPSLLFAVERPVYSLVRWGRIVVATQALACLWSLLAGTCVAGKHSHVAAKRMTLRAGTIVVALAAWASAELVYWLLTTGSGC